MLKTACFFLGILLFIFILTEMTPLVADDYNYAFSWSYDYPMRIDNMTLLKQSMWSHRQWTHGRVFASGWVSLFLMGPLWLFSLANAAVNTAFFGSLFCFFKKNGVKKALEATGAAFALLWICMPVYGQVFLWMDGACNYFWGAALGWILIERFLALKEGKWRNLRMLLLAPLAFYVGGWSEHISFSVLMVLFLTSAEKWIWTKEFPIRELFLLLSGGAGYLWLMLAPSMLPSVLKYRAKNAIGDNAGILALWLGQYIWMIFAFLVAIVLAAIIMRKTFDRRERISVTAYIIGICSAVMGLISVIAELWKSDIFSAISSARFGFFSVVAFFFLALGDAVHKKTDRKTIVLALIFFFSGLCALPLFVAALYVPARAFCSPVVFTVIASCLLYYKTEKTPFQAKVTGITLLLCFLLFASVGLLDIWNVHMAAKERERAIAHALETDGVLIARPYPCRTKYSAQYELSDLSKGEYWPNDYVKWYYGLKEIIVVDSE